ncbi:hypothetical protein [Salegentibacter sp. Hel_I_6]|uniref:hypothetical protein n=1 Tax=Salegentibacter sp. Hel_I_6 TaxID=1250278 RepID=UPI000567708D|nr:hypothetical protein [Salegentibacter sp. Hel_I_6]
MKKLLFLNLLCFALFSCDKEESYCCSPGDDDIFEFSILNASGEDLLDPSTDESLNTSSIKIFKIIDGSKLEINNPNSDYPEGYQIVEGEDNFRFIPLFANSDPEVSKGIIEWNENDSDTLTLYYTDQSEETTRLTKIIYNAKEVWKENEENNERRFFEIEK